MKRNRNGISVSAAIIGFCALIIVICIYFIWAYQVKIGAGLVLASLLLLIAIYHRLQTKHAVLRNFPLLGSFRYAFEKIRPELRQYFFESDLDGKPFNRRQRSIVYQRAKNEKQTVAFGMQDDPAASGFEWLSHSIYPVHVDPGQLRVQVGNGQCAQPYNASILNISAMSYGALSKTAIEALNLGAKIGNFAHNTGEGGISSYHLSGGDLIWQIGTGYFGCRNSEGRFDPQLYRNNAMRPEVKMIELKLSQGAKPGHGGILPAQKNTPEIAAIRHVEPGTTVHSPANHTAFSDAEGLVDFIDVLRNLSDGKPVGFKLCVGEIREFEDICKAMVHKNIYPDFITVDGAEGGTGAAPLEFTDHLGMPLYDALAQVCNMLNLMDVKKHIRIFAAGRIITGFDIIKALALGADAVYSARGMMMSLGCIQALQCDSGKCPVGVATQQPNLFKGLDVTDKKVRVANFHGNTLKAVAELMEACGFKDATAIHPSRIHRRIRVDLTRTFEEIYFNGSWQNTAPVSGISLHYN